MKRLFLSFHLGFLQGLLIPVIAVLILVSFGLDWLADLCRGVAFKAMRIVDTALQARNNS